MVVANDVFAVLVLSPFCENMESVLVDVKEVVAVMDVAVDCRLDEDDLDPVCLPLGGSGTANEATDARFLSDEVRGSLGDGSLSVDPSESLFPRREPR